MKLTIGKKLLGSFLIVCLLLVTVSYLGISTITKLEADSKEIVDVNLPLQVYIWRIKANQLDKVSSVRGYIIYQESSQLEKYTTADQNMQKFYKEVAPLLSTTESKNYLAKIQEDDSKYDALAEKIFTAVQQGNTALAMSYATQAKPYVDQLRTTTEEWDTFADKLNSQDVQRATTEGTQSKNLTYYVAIIAIILSSVLGFFISRGISKSIVQMAKTAARIAQGDLTVERLNIRSKDEIGDMAITFNNMVENLQKLIRQVNNSAQQVAATSEELTATSEQNSAGAQQISTAIQELAKGNTEQTTLVNETVEIIEQLTKSIDNIASGAQEQARNVTLTSESTNAVAQKVQDVVIATDGLKQAAQQNFHAAQNGDLAVNKSVEGLKRIQVAVEDSARKITGLGKQSQQIGEIIQVIDDIAEQTNLLALNAAIEAARAGEHGKGFAVVADEVRKLAERSGKATKEIAELITNIQTGTEVAVKSMEVGTEEVEHGVVISQEAKAALADIISVVQQSGSSTEIIIQTINEIATSIDEVSKAAENVAAITEQNTAATEQMAAGSGQVNSSITNIAAIAQESAASAEEVSASTEELNASTEEIAASAQELARMAQDLQEAIAKFKV